MTDPQKHYIMTFRHNAEQPAAWQQIVADIPGVTVISILGRQSRIKANAAAIRALREQFSSDILIEEDLPRHF